jgi:hypothetical protein
MSTIAVFLVVGGASAFAASKIGSNQLKANSVVTGKIKKEAITTAKIRNDAVTGAKANESTFGQVPSAASATTATIAEGPSAFAHVSSGGTLLAGRGVTVSLGGASYYCLSGISFAPAGLQATADYWNGTPNFNTMVQVGLASAGGLGGTGCPAGTQAFVHGTKADNDAPASVAFYVVLFK